MTKLQKVKFHRGDRRPGDQMTKDLHYRKRMIKKDNDIVWQVMEYPHKRIVAEYFFEEDAHKLVKFQNKNKTWNLEGGIPKFLCIYL